MIRNQAGATFTIADSAIGDPNGSTWPWFAATGWWPAIAMGDDKERQEDEVIVKRIGHLLVRLIFVLLIVCAGANAAYARTVADTPWGVHVCTAAHYNRAQLLCTQDAVTLSAAAFPSARLSITGRGGGAFTSNTLTLILQSRTADGDVELGRTTLDVGLADNVTQLPVARVFSLLGVEPAVNATYVIEADESDGGTQLLLGVAVFTLRSPTSAGPPAAPTGGSLALVVTERFGAALRVYPSSEAPIKIILSCGAQLTAFAQANGWYHVRAGGAGSGWVGGLRVAALSSAPSYDCRGAVTYQVGTRVRTYVPTGCLSLRAYPSRAAPYNHCVSNGHQYVIINGPIEVSGEDWFGVYSATTGSGWSLAQYLLPAGGDT